MAEDGNLLAGRLRCSPASLRYDQVLFVCGGAFVGLEESSGRGSVEESLGLGRWRKPARCVGCFAMCLPEDLEKFGLIPGDHRTNLPVIAPLDALGVEDLARVLQTPKNFLIAQYRKLVRFHGADLAFTDGAVKEIAWIALERGTGARGLRAMIEEILEGILFATEPEVLYVITEKTVRGGEAVRQSLSVPMAPARVRRLWVLMSTGFASTWTEVRHQQPPTLRDARARP